MEYIQVTTTLEKEEDARKLAASMVEKRLAACVQIVGPISSTYWWKGKIEEASEWLCVLKTRRNLFKKLETEIRAMHPYEVPEIIAVPVMEGSKDYLDWIEKETEV